jgi:hypothetical protein
MLMIVGNDPSEPDTGMGPGVFVHTFQVAENRAVDVPMPPTSPWKCRVSAIKLVVAKDTESFVTRNLACSNDGWRTYVEATGSYCLRTPCNVEENSVDLGLPTAGSGGVGTLRLAARPQLSTAKYPELP